eukprot:CAMPEP_0119127062 /NCGR_PEP_ID=MMETSP1310-20130426/5743_1 /TAXON_ID=464262 /ORGANISM="Genus nov. species nov., Strain RCC2339" /LENGTH=516 /DNA_ID=CAMNT_0007117283 /DNA_START=104 /DNA_END=1650 /DNA_ORIENTATION=-
MAFEFQQTEGFILCCLCGVKIRPNPSNMCITCIKGQVDITEGIPKQVPIQWCKGCGRYFVPPAQWVMAELESRDLLAFCLKRVKNLGKVRLVDAGFIYTEPHSKRLKVRVKIQKEVFANTILEQSFIIEFVVQNQFCPECHRQAASQTWTAVVQARQKVTHKRTFLFLEQVILKYNMHSQAVNIKEYPNGLDFYFTQRSHAIKFCEFLSGIVPIRMKTSEKLISRDEQNNIHNYKFTYSVELVPICREDLVFIPKKTANALSSMSQLVLCTRVTANLSFVDPFSLKQGNLQAAHYWRLPFESLATSPQLVEYVVLDIVRTGQQNGRYALADVAVVRASDFGRNDIQFLGTTHLGNILHVGDSALGYDLSTLNLNCAELKANRRTIIPDFVLVKKHYPNRKRSKNRPWRLQSIPKEEADGKRTKDMAMRERDDYEYFLRELEEDKELRQNVNVFKDPNFVKRDLTDTDDMTDGEEAPEIPLEEMLEALSLGEAPAMGEDAGPFAGVHQAPAMGEDAG